MTFLPQLSDSTAGIAPVEVVAPAESLPRAASENAVRLALSLREMRSSAGGRTLLFVPVSASVDVSTLVDDAMSGLLELREGPVLLMDLRVTGGEPAQHSKRWFIHALDEDGEMAMTWRAAATSTAAFAFPFEGRRDTVPYAASPEFAAVLARARAEYAYVICVGAAISSSVETLITAALCDGVVLSVTPGKTTRTDMHRIVGQLGRAHANVIGFVVDARSGRKEA